jgi:hypothetical protein
MARIDAVAVGCLVAVVGAASSSTARERQNAGAVIEVAVSNLASVSGTTLAAARAKAGAFLASAGIESAWIDFSTRAATDAATQARAAFKVRVLVRPRQAAWEPGKVKVMGVSAAGDSTGGIVSIFMDAVEEVALRHGVSVWDMLGLALAHEIGHVLLPPSAHSVFGVMKGDWNGDDIRAAVLGELRFTDAQGSLMREKAGAALRTQ